MTVQFKSILLCCCMLEQHIIYFLRLMVVDVDVSVALSELCNGSNPIGSNRIEFQSCILDDVCFIHYFLLCFIVVFADVNPSNHRYHSLWFIRITSGLRPHFKLVKVSNSISSPARLKH